MGAKSRGLQKAVGGQRNRWIIHRLEISAKINKSQPAWPPDRLQFLFVNPPVDASEENFNQSVCRNGIEFRIRCRVDDVLARTISNVANMTDNQPYTDIACFGEVIVKCLKRSCRCRIVPYLNELFEIDMLAAVV